LLCRPVPPSRDGRYASTQWALVDWPPSRQSTSPGWCVAQDQLHRRTRIRLSSGKDPPKVGHRTCAGGVRLEVLANLANFSTGNALTMFQASGVGVPVRQPVRVDAQVIDASRRPSCRLT
jgi:hypothetical protein